MTSLLLLLLGSVLGAVGDTISTSYVTGVKTVVSDYYNDQIREIYASKPDMGELKEVSKLRKWWSVYSFCGALMS